MITWTAQSASLPDDNAIGAGIVSLELFALSGAHRRQRYILAFSRSFKFLLKSVRLGRNAE